MIDIAALDEATKNRAIVTGKVGQTVVTGIALGHSLRRSSVPTVKIGFVDESGNYTGDFTHVPAGNVRP